ncbi:hypothetical protein [Thalassospira lucentensis]|jgi:hypothetical protein|uniref:Uracil-DNA glycosylase-like domain-containing protein n=1 Tax=Thalassospira lucentensis TaxID=168935 RepID=A0A358HPQ9_9PROT|nr:hypothetical protein [Thalassospira lucentensis]HBU97141.1 hypothetical protein [Thalassospira lucentensis]HCW66503.1 hypothetical protein [Thalassospira lucentensis]|tara:strand:- start:1591 stop:2310 length:720 start_codon:yes stop_codon:yes gene_type:complete
MVNGLRKSYETIIRRIENIAVIDDQYSGVFLVEPFDEYFDFSPRIFIVGRETAGWNTDNNKNTIARIQDNIEKNEVSITINDSLTRYKKHLGDGKGRGFKRFFSKLAKETGRPKEAREKSITYANAYAWDFNNKTPQDQPDFKYLETISRELLRTQIDYLKPDIIIFAATITGLDNYIRKLFPERENLDPFVAKKFWHFKAEGIDCFRIAHPRSINGEHPKYRELVIDEVKKIIAEKHL